MKYYLLDLNGLKLISSMCDEFRKVKYFKETKGFQILLVKAEAYLKPR